MSGCRVHAAGNVTYRNITAYNEQLRGTGMGPLVRVEREEHFLSYVHIWPPPPPR